MFYASTPVKEYCLPILEALIEMRGGGRARTVLGKVYQKMRARLTPEDHEILLPGVPKWYSYASQAKLYMLRKGWLEKGSPRGIWEITPEGRDYYERAKAGG